MRLVTPWGIECGLATYAEHLAEALDDVDIAGERIPNGLSERRRVDGVQVDRCWLRTSADYGELLEQIESNGGLAHFNHEYSLFPHQTEFLGLLKRLKADGFRVVFTVHSMHPLGKSEHLAFCWHWDAFRMADAVIVHNADGVTKAVECGLESSRVHHVPHGTVIDSPADRIAARRCLSLPEHGVIGASVGFVTPNKRMVETVRAAMAAPELAAYVVAGWVTPLDFSGKCLEHAEELRRLAKQDRRIVFMDRFLTDQDIWRVHSAVDFETYFYQSPVLSTSGAARYALTYGLPTIISDVPMLDDLRPSSVVLQAEAPTEELTAAMQFLARSPGVREIMSRRALEIARATSWDVVGAQHQWLYEEVMG